LKRMVGLRASKCLWNSEKLALTLSCKYSPIRTSIEELPKL
jgi:hypothetical protein